MRSYLIVGIDIDIFVVIAVGSVSDIRYLFIEVTRFKTVLWYFYAQ